MKAGIDERRSEISCESRKEGWTDSSNRVSILVATDSHVERIAHAFGCNIVQVRRPVNRSRQIYPHLVIGLPRLETRRNLTHIRHTCLYTFIFFTLQFSHMSNVSQYPRTIHFISPSILLSISPETNTHNDEYTRYDWKTTIPWTVEHHFDPSSFENVSHCREEYTRGSWNFRSFVRKSSFVRACIRSSKWKLSRSKQFPLDRK